MPETPRPRPTAAAPAIADPGADELSAYLDGELPLERLEEIDRWLASNPAHAKELQQIRMIERELARAARRGDLHPRKGSPER